MTREMYESISLHDLREIAKNRLMQCSKKMRRRRKLTVRRGSSAGRS